jgi:hypothetical protein
MKLTHAQRRALNSALQGAFQEWVETCPSDDYVTLSIMLNAASAKRWRDIVEAAAGQSPR